MKALRHLWLLRRASSILLFAWWLAPIASRGATVPRLVSTPTEIADRTISPFVLADFDGDDQLDIASVQSGRSEASQTRYWIELQLTSGPEQLVTLTAPAGGVRLHYEDVNGDNALDLVVTSRWGQRAVAVLLNDGRGHFSLREPRGLPSGTSEARHSVSFPNFYFQEPAATVGPRSSIGEWEALARFLPVLILKRAPSVVSLRQNRSPSLLSLAPRAPPLQS